MIPTTSVGNIVHVNGPEIVAQGLPLGEGPAEHPDGTWLMAGVADGWVWKVNPESGDAYAWADVGGGANSVVATADGGAIVAQNGGIDLRSVRGMENQPPVRPVPAGLQRVEPGGTVCAFAGPAQASNDIVVVADGTVWFTDPPHYPPQTGVFGQIRRVSRPGVAEIWAGGFTYCNGLARWSDGVWLVTEGKGLMKVHGPGPAEREWLVEALPGAGDGMCVDEADNVYVAIPSLGAFVVIDREGQIVETIAPPVRGMVTDCAFVGPDRRTFVGFVAVPGVLVAWEGMPTAGQPQPYPANMLGSCA